VTDFLYFLRWAPGVAVAGHRHISVSAANIDDRAIAALEAFTAAGGCVLLDSGWDGLVAAHAKAHKMPLEDAAALSPLALDGWDAFWHHYREVATRLAPTVWGYLDVPCHEWDRRVGLRRSLQDAVSCASNPPMPSYLPLVDGSEPFEHWTASIAAVHGFAGADDAVRLRLLATLSECAAFQPGVDIQLHGFGPLTPALAAWPVDSVEVVDWSEQAEGDGVADYIAGRPFARVPRRVKTETSRAELAAYVARHAERNLNQQRAAYAAFEVE
jgi:hypothetical protein